MDWTEENVAKLKELVEAGLTSRAIGVALGCSKNAVIGQVMRRGWKLHHKPCGPSSEPKPVPTPFDVLPEVVYEPAAGVAFADLKDTHCRALRPDGDYCGAPIAHPKFSYCEHHKKEYLTTPARMRAREAAEARAKLGRWM